MTPPRRSAARGTAVLQPPDLLGEEGRKAIAAATLKDLQGQRFSLEMSMRMNDHDDGNIVPGTEERHPMTGQPIEDTGKTYKQRFAEIDGFVRRWMDNYSDLLE